MKRLALVALMGATFLLLGGTQAFAQPNPQRDRTQQMDRLQTMVQNMDRVRDRLHQLSLNLQQQIRTEERERVRERLRAMQQLCTNTEALNLQLKSSADRLQTMMMDQDMIRDQDMQRDMDRLREHMEGMSLQMDETVRTMEQMRQRIHQIQ